MKPLARTEGLVIRESADGLRIQDTLENQEYKLHRITAAVWRNANGLRAIADLAELVSRQLGLTADEERIWAALDRLADAKLLVARLAPPAGGQHLSRRTLLRRLGLAAAVALPAVLLGSAPNADAQVGRGQEQRSKEQNHKAQEQRSKEQAHKAQEQRSKEQAHKAQEQRSKDKHSEQRSKEQRQKIG
jgi:hypothetical protein